LKRELVKIALLYINLAMTVKRGNYYNYFIFNDIYGGRVDNLIELL